MCKSIPNFAKTSWGTCDAQVKSSRNVTLNWDNFKSKPSVPFPTSHILYITKFKVEEQLKMHMETNFSSEGTSVCAQRPSDR